MSYHHASHHIGAKEVKMDGAQGYTRREVLDLMAAGGLAAMLGGIPYRAFARNDDVLRLGYLPITDATALLVAHAKGFFEEEGLKVAKPQPVKRWSTLVKGFAGGHFNLVHLLKPIPVWMRYNNQVPVKIMAWAHLNGSAIMVGGNSGINDFADLGGRRMAIPYWYSMHNIVLQAGLRQAGIRPVVDQGREVAENECALQVLPPPAMVKALATEKIAGFTVAEPYNALGELKLGAKVLRFTGDIWRNHPCCVVCMHEHDIDSRPEWVQKVINAIVRAEIYSSVHKTEVAHLLSNNGAGYLPVPAKVVERAMTYYDEAGYTKPMAIRNKKIWHNNRIDFSPYPYPSATRLIVEAMGKTVVDMDNTFLDRISPDFAVRDLVEYGFVEKALKDNPRWKSLPGVDKEKPFEREEVLSV